MTTPGTHREVRDAIEYRRGAVNDAVPDELPVVDPERLWGASRYLLDAGGKRLRPTVLLLTAEALADVPPGSRSYRSFPAIDDNPVDILSAAISVEIIQTFTLIHDDIMDDDTYRRGVETVHEAFDLETAILAGDTLYAKSFEIMLNTDTDMERVLRSVRLLAETCTAICEGQARDVGFEGRDDVTLEEYIEMIDEKTAVLYATSAALPGILLGADDTVIDELYAFGMDFGRAFQMKDDVLDVTADTSTLGKDQGSDLTEAKRTAVTIHAQEQGLDVDSLVDDAGSVDAAVERLYDAGSIDHAEELASDHVASARDHLEVLPDTEATSLLEDLSQFIIERSY